MGDQWLADGTNFYQMTLLNEDIKKIFQGFAKDKKASGVFLAQPTGAVLEEDPTYIEVLLYGKSVFAKPCMAFGSYNVPDAAWLEKYKEEISVWVAFENGNPAHPVYLGVAPRDGKAPKENFPEVKSRKTTEFSYSFNDSDKVFRLSKINELNEETHKIEVTENGVQIADAKNNIIEFDFTTSAAKVVNSNNNGIRINEFTDLGKGSATHSMLLGEELLNKITSALVEISSALNSIATGIIVVNPLTGTGILNPASLGAVTTGITKLTQIQLELVSTLSKNVKLD